MSLTARRAEFIRRLREILLMVQRPVGASEELLIARALDQLEDEVADEIDSLMANRLIKYNQRRRDAHHDSGKRVGELLGRWTRWQTADRELRAR